MKGKTFVLTGSLEHYTREEAKELVEALGGARDLQGKQTDYVVVGELPGSKLRDAEHLHVKRLNESEFRKMIEP